MKKLLLLALTLCALNFNVIAQEKNNTKISVTKLDINVHCNSCKEKIERSLLFEKGIKDLNVNVEKNDRI